MNRESREGLYSSVVSRFRPVVSFFRETQLSQNDQDGIFAMRCNGYFLLENGEWRFSSEALQPFLDEFTGQKVSFFGPNSQDYFFTNKKIGHERYLSAFGQPIVTEVIGKYRIIDEDQAARIAFLLGGIARHLTSIPGYGNNEIATAVGFAARMTKLGEPKSADAIASATAMYIISGGSLDTDNSFMGKVYYMADAISQDPVVPVETKDLGLSQVARLRASLGYEPLPDISEFEAAFDGFPTVGAEFHFPSYAPYHYPGFWQRLAILNMSQYQRGSYVQFSRNDRDVIEVRMNPSIYPVTVANWHYIRGLLPELKQTFFTATINRMEDRDFQWANTVEDELLNNLRAIGMLSYAGTLDTIPRMGKSEEVDFGQVYLGQTVRMRSGIYKFTGNYGTVKQGVHGQMGIYAGFDDNLPYLAYYPSMVLANPDILRSVHRDFFSRIRTLGDALAVSPADGRTVFGAIQERIEADRRLSRVAEAGRRIVELLKPKSQD